MMENKVFVNIEAFCARVNIEAFFKALMCYASPFSELTLIRTLRFFSLSFCFAAITFAF